ncbi:MAG TPA: hypothetical protein VHE33_09020 [Acidobacteriaceae bacterium]|nr:hypothetical protein [Acidobacteriaceae bacterium]
MSNISAVRAAIASQVGTYAYPQLRSLTDPYGQINPPTGIVVYGRPYVNYVTTLQGATAFGGVLGADGPDAPMSPTEVGLDYLILVSQASTVERFETALDLWLGLENDGTAVSVAAAISKDPTLGGTVQWCLPTTVDPPGPVSWNGTEYFGARLHLTVSLL